MMRTIRRIDLTRDKAVKILETILKENCPEYDPTKIKPDEFNLAKLSEQQKKEVIGQYIEACNTEVRHKTGCSISNPNEWEMPDGQEPEIIFIRGSDLVMYVLSEKKAISSQIRESCYSA